MSYVLNLPQPKGHVMSMKCKQPINELTVQVSLLYDHPNILILPFICKLEGFSYEQSDTRTFQVKDMQTGLTRTITG